MDPHELGTNFSIETLFFFVRAEATQLNSRLQIVANQFWWSFVYMRAIAINLFTPFCDNGLSFCSILYVY